MLYKYNNENDTSGLHICFIAYFEEQNIYISVQLIRMKEVAT